MVSEIQNQHVSRPVPFQSLQQKTLPGYIQLLVAAGIPWLVAAAPQSLLLFSLGFLIPEMPCHWAENSPSSDCETWHSYSLPF